MRVVVNGAPRELEGPVTLAALAADAVGGEAGQGVAIAHNGEVVRRSSWNETRVAEGDRVEILVATQGG
ncbi:MAG TPA: sulfur carrier protein ThiS [Actinomycetota bacterium]|nr:sulfur carrier protein ThiS [Actinomycetota bacterium]